MVKSQLPTVLFDLDGTLVDTLPLFEQASLHAFQSIGVSLDPREFRELYQMNLRLSRIAERLSHGEHLETLRQVRDDRYIQMLTTTAQWLPDAVSLLPYLKKKKGIGIVTGSWKSYVDALNIRLGVSFHASVIVTADDVAQGKPHPEGLLLAAEKLNADPRNCVYVGDQDFDMEAAANAGMEGWLIKRPHTPARAGDIATKTFGSLEELKSLELE